MLKGSFGNLKKVWRCRRNFGGAGRKTHFLDLPTYMGLIHIISSLYGLEMSGARRPTAHISPYFH